MSDYQVLARKYRPKKFKEVIGQDPVVITLQNALKTSHLHHAYLFSGPRGTGKTTLARLFAKGLNCEKLTPELEPCCECASCLAIGAGSSIDFIEIDGASHRGIDDIRMITESAGYRPQQGTFKIFLIDEVHMLTKEAFNALLKTLEEPPSSIKFFFATTELHKVPETILSRCMRFQLKRISKSSIVHKLKKIADDLQIQGEEGAFLRIAEYAEGALRDAESLFDQIIAFCGKQVTESKVHEVLGLMAKETLFSLDEAYAKEDFSFAFTTAEKLFSEGKDLRFFLTDLMHHFRKLLLTKLNSLQEPSSYYVEASRLYNEQALMQILEYILKATEEVKQALSEQLLLEVLLLKILREKERISIATLVKKLKEMTPPPLPPADPRLEILATLPQKKEEPIQPPVAAVKNSPQYDTIMQFAAVELDGSIQSDVNWFSRNEKAIYQERVC
jgi:DNA polymerase III subunit gamma/tau